MIACVFKSFIVELLQKMRNLYKCFADRIEALNFGKHPMTNQKILTFEIYQS